MKVPGQVSGWHAGQSPGMDGAVYGGRRDLRTLLVLKSGDSRVFASYNKRSSP
jgi:hypothetical protein